MGYQSITILGNLTRDVEVRQVGQSQVGKAGVAVSEKFRKQDGTVVENTEFFDIEIWDKASVFPFLTKGAQVLVVGQQKTDKWQDQNGQNREAKKIRVQVIQLCGGKPQQAQQTTQVAQPRYQQAAPAPAPAPQQRQAQPAPAPQYAPSPAPQPQYTPSGYQSNDPDLPF